MTDTLLLVEDTPSLQMVYEAFLTKAGFDVDCANTAGEAAHLFARSHHRIILLDLLLPDRDGLDLMADMLVEDPDLKVIVITANGSINRAVSAMRGGAFDFLVKPFAEQRLIASVENAQAILKDVNAAVQDAGVTENRFYGFIGASAAMLAVYKKISSIGRSMATVFITGDSGTGKEVCAEAIHRQSNRASGPFVALNCGAIPGDLLESEVFGHLKGSFTGAISDKPGAAAAAHGGTLFLDEICEMDILLQTKLLRFLETSSIQPVGSVVPKKIDVRIICATNRNPTEEVAAGRFREDLFYRIHVVPIHLPPLKGRDEDAIAIAMSALKKFTQEEGKKFTGFSKDVLKVFAAHPWPGNVRQLLNVVRNAVVLHDGEIIELKMFAPDFLAALHKGSCRDAGVESQRAGTHSELSSRDLVIEALLETGQSMAEIERAVIEAAIARFKGSVPRAARHLDVSPSTIYRKRDAWMVADRDRNSD